MFEFLKQNKFLTGKLFEVVSTTGEIEKIIERIDKQKSSLDIFYLLSAAPCQDFLQLYNFLYQIRDKGITVPVVAGIMPVTNAKQMKKILAMSGANIPAKFRAILDRFGDNPASMRQAGVAYATDQIVDLIANGVNAIHVYSMNKPDVAAQIKNSLSEIIV